MSQVTDGLGRPAQYRQASRKGKKAWRKNIDLIATEAALEDLREQERAEGVPAHKRSNAELFMEDRSGQETTLARQAREKRKLKSQEILAHRSAVPAMQQKARPSFQLPDDSSAAKAAAAGLPPKFKKRLRMLASRPHEGVEGETERGRVGRLQSDAVLAEKHDLWGEAPKTRQNDWIAPAAKDPVHRPRSMQHEPYAAARSMPAVSVPHPGTSYNPDFDSHEALVETAYEKAKAAELDEQQAQELHAQWKGVTQGVPLPLDLPLDVPEEGGEDGEDDEEVQDEGAAPKMPARKTAAQRRREARAKEQYTLAQQRRKERRIQGMISELPNQMKQAKRDAQTRAELVQQRRQQKEERLRSQGIAGTRIGKYAVPSQRVDVQTGDELSDSLRRLRPEGNLFWDRFQSLQARGLAEARKPVLPMRQRRKLKTYDRHSFKRD